jgi:hypothetical protein
LHGLRERLVSSTRIVEKGAPRRCTTTVGAVPGETGKRPLAADTARGATSCEAGGSSPRRPGGSRTASTEERAWSPRGEQAVWESLRSSAWSSIRNCWSDRRLPGSVSCLGGCTGGVTDSGAAAPSAGRSIDPPAAGLEAHRRHARQQVVQLAVDKASPVEGCGRVQGQDDNAQLGLADRLPPPEGHHWAGCRGDCIRRLYHRLKPCLAMTVLDVADMLTPSLHASGIATPPVKPPCCALRLREASSLCRNLADRCGG